MVGPMEAKKRGRDSLEQAGKQLYVLLKMENHKLTGDLVPHIYGSIPIVCSWDPSKAALIMDRGVLDSVINRLLEVRETWEIGESLGSRNQAALFSFQGYLLEATQFVGT